MRCHTTLLRIASFLLFALSAALPMQVHSQVGPLPKLNIDIKQTSVSGISAGGFMAVQFDVAFSSISKGAGVIAGGPYFCAKGNQNTATTVCMNPGTPNAGELIQITESSASAGAIDPTSNLAGHRIWLFSGTADQTVKQSVMNELEKYYKRFISGDKIFYKKELAAGHAVPTDSFGNACSETKDPFINNCAFDGAGELLKWIYGGLNSPNTERLRGSVIEFDQSQFIANPNSHSMANTGWVYVPENCRQGAPCRLHIAFHGCKQFPSYQFFSPGSGMVIFGRTFVDNAGYNRWADTNNIVVLYPQTTNGNGNPLGCWNWFAYDNDANYAKKNGLQMTAVKAMVDRLASPTLPAPQGLAVSLGQDPQRSAQLSWNPVSGAAGFNVYRNGGKVTANPLNDTRFADTGLTTGTTYTYLVRAADSSGREGSASEPKSIKTQGQPPAVAAPTGLTAGNVSASSVALSWTAAPDVAGYNVLFRADSADGGAGQFTKANPNLIAATSFTVGGLNPGTAYRFVVRSQAGADASSADSNEVSATTAPPVTACFTTSNFNHVQAGRAHAANGFALANGSNLKMGLNNIFFITTLKQTSPNFYVIDNLACP
jgi:poly(3-hydroxybutyrate) depolymerase/chitodextrinase